MRSANCPRELSSAAGAVRRRAPEHANKGWWTGERYALRQIHRAAAVWLEANLRHLFATVENRTVASKLQELKPQPSTIQLVASYVSMRCHMLRVDEDTFTMISGLIVIAVVCVGGLLALGA